MRVSEGGYEETVQLSAELIVHLRNVRPEDAPLFEAGFDHLSPRTRYLRFFVPKQTLTEAELRSFTEVVDGDVAVGALGAPGSRYEAAPMGVARYNLIHHRAAEVALVVVDAFQGQGLGGLLLDRLTRAAIEAGVEQLKFTTLPENLGLTRLVKRAFPQDQRQARIEDGALVWRVQLPELRASPAA